MCLNRRRRPKKLDAPVKSLATEIAAVIIDDRNHDWVVREGANKVKVEVGENIPDRGSSTLGVGSAFRPVKGGAHVLLSSDQG